MANIWKENRDVTQRVGRNNHDLSYDNHLTCKFGYLYPVYRQFVVPGDSLRIRSAFDLKMMPLVFPLQSRVRAHLHFFYVRYKNCWPEIEDYLTGVHRNNPLVEPYIAPSDDKVKTGSIYDFLGVPTTVVTNVAVAKRYRFLNLQFDDSFVPLFWKSSDNQVVISKTSDGMTGQAIYFVVDDLIDSNVFDLPDLTSLSTYLSGFSGTSDSIHYPSGGVYKTLQGSSYSFSIEGSKVTYTIGGSDSTFIEKVNEAVTAYGSCIISIGYSTSVSSPEPFLPFMPAEPAIFSVSQSKVPAAGFYEYSDLHLDFYKNKKLLKALPFRVYEQCYRAYYANDILQPLIDENGDAQYNRFNENQNGGLDTTDYHLFKRNYEYDFLTSAYPSPQAGPAPLVGISALGTITVEDENGISTAKAQLDDKGNSTGVVVTSPLASVEHGRIIMNMAQAGFNINDFRNANALQKFLEQTLRSGYRYIDFIKGQWGVRPKDQALDMPEFIGGFSRDVVINTVTSVADTGSDSLSSTLGGFGANGRVIGGSDFPVSKFCDDYGEIIGILSITPTPAYSQLLDKSMIAGDNYLSFPFPEFNQTGMVPIPYKEVAPLQAYLDSLEDSVKSINDTFGYQRPNYNLVGRVDEVHGEFRGTLRNFLINRIFDGRPELGSKFIEIDPAEVNDVFVNQNPDDDVIIGHLRFKVDSKRPFPRKHIPGL